jgi:trk system potassium uptake protein TrkA
MSRSQQVIVVGLGRFGTALALMLTRVGHQVLAIDTSAERVREVADEVTHAVQADATDEEVLKQLDAGAFDAGFVGVSSNVEKSILATMLLKRLGVPLVIAKAQTPIQGEVLAKVGADRVVYPERETGERLAHSFSVHQAVDYMALGPDYGISKLTPPPAYAGRTVRELALGERFKVALLAIERASQVIINPGPEERIAATDLLVVAGADDDVERVG